MTRDYSTRCRVDGCTQDQRYRRVQLCGMHYQRMRRTGSFDLASQRRLVTHRGPKERPLETRLALYTPSDLPGDDCWEWTGYRNDRGYALISVKEGGVWRKRFVSRLLLGLAVGDPRVARHRCDNPPCVNPDHLLVGTHQDNTNDKLARRREIRGAQHGLAKLTDELVMAIRADQRSSLSWGRQLGVSPGLIRQVRRGHIWTHVPLDVAGYRPGQRKLTPEQREEIGASSKPATELAADFGVDVSLVRRYRRDYRIRTGAA